MSHFKIAFAVLAVASLSSLAGCTVQSAPEPTESSSAALGCVSSQDTYCPPPSSTAGEHPLECVSIAWPTDPTSTGKRNGGCVDPQACSQYEPWSSFSYYQATCNGVLVQWNDPMCTNGNCAPSLKGEPHG